MERQQTANGVDRCRSCGSSDISFDGAWLVCGYCHQRWNTAVLAEELRLSEGIENLVGTSALVGAKDIDTSSLVTVRCDGCGAELTINSETTLSATCHWCRHTLSLNHPVDNGAIPDAILPFYVTREDAAERMATYVGTHRRYASAAFVRDFDHASPQPAYLPYLVVDGKVTVRLEGRAWLPDPRSPRWEGPLSGNGFPDPSARSSDQQFITEEFAVMREADLLVDDLAIEARSTRTRLYAAVSTTNIINAIQPFDVEHAVRFNANYITEGVAFERRDTEVADATGDAAGLFATITRGYVNQTLKQYTGGVRWESETVAIKGSRWISVLLPVWLYAFEETTPTGPMMHYIAVNGRTGETEGSVPIDEARARAASRKLGWIAGAFVGVPPLIIAASVAGSGVFSGDLNPVAAAGVGPFAVIGLALGVAFGRFNAKWRLKTIAERQRNLGARLKAEVETKYTPTRLQESDHSLGTFTHLGGPEIEDRNDHHPEVRAEHSQFVLGDLPQPTDDERATADFVWNPKRGAQFDKRDRARAGQPPSAYPPGTVVRAPIQLIPGWHES